MINLYNFYIENIKKDNYYYRFYEFITNDNLSKQSKEIEEIFGISNYTYEDKIREYEIYDEEEAIKKLRDLCEPNLSIDECFLDLSGTSYLYKDYLKLAEEMRSYINESFGITVNIGIASNRLCAKMASDFEKPNKIHTLFPDEIATKMWPLPVGDLFMVGKKSVITLNQLGIHTIGDLAHADVRVLTKYFKNNAQGMIDSANGRDDSKIEPYVPKDKSISVSETLPSDIESLPKLKEILLYQADRVGRSLRKDKKYAGVVAVTFKTKDFVSYSHQMKLSTPINTTEEIYKTACDVLKKGWRGEAIRLIGIRLGNLVEGKIRQYSIFDEEKDEYMDKMQEVIDGINDKYGGSKIMPASMKRKEEK